MKSTDGLARRMVTKSEGVIGSPGQRGFDCSLPPPSSCLLNQCPESAGRVPNATRRLPGILPSPVTMAANILAPVLVGHCAGSSNSARTGARPCARLGSDEMHRTRAPVSSVGYGWPAERCLVPTIALVRTSMDVFTNIRAMLKCNPRLGQ